MVKEKIRTFIVSCMKEAISEIKQTDKNYESKERKPEQKNSVAGEVLKEWLYGKE